GGGECAQRHSPDRVPCRGGDRAGTPIALGRATARAVSTGEGVQRRALATIYRSRAAGPLGLEANRRDGWPDRSRRGDGLRAVLGGRQARWWTAGRARGVAGDGSCVPVLARAAMGAAADRQ